jgi:hypothetical protein
MRTLAGLMGLTCLLVAGPAAAKQTEAESTAQALLKQAADATKAKDADRGAKAIAELAGLAAKEKSLGIEERATDAFEGLVDALDVEPPVPGATVAKAGPREVLAIVMKSLDPARHGVFLSAHALAAELVLRAGEQGDSAHLDAARAVLTAYVATPKCGKAAAAVLELAEAIRATREGSKDAPTRLAAAAGLLNAGAWLRPSLVCAFERLVLDATGGDIAGAERVAAEIGARLQPSTDLNLVRTWREAVTRRFGGLPESLQATLRKVLDPYWAGAPGNGGRAGDDGVGPNAQSPLGKAWQRLAPAKAVVSAKRLPSEFLIEVGLGKEPAARHPAQDGQKHWTKDGIHLAFGDGGVALLMFDLVGNRGQQGERSSPSAVRAWYWLAPGETYAATKTGVVITGP